MARGEISEEDIEEEEEETPEWKEEENQERDMEGFFDYKNLMINPAARNIFKSINRDLQLGNLTEKDYKIVYLHLHLGMELDRFESLNEAAKFILQRGFAHLVLSNSKQGFQRRLEATSIRIQKLQKDGEKERSWLRWKK